MTEDRREFLKKLGIAAPVLAAPGVAAAASNDLVEGKGRLPLSPERIFEIYVGESMWQLRQRLFQENIGGPIVQALIEAQGAALAKILEQLQRAV